MSNINKFLQKILSARFGEEVRQSIHDAIKEIDSVADTAQNSASAYASNAKSCMQSASLSAQASATSEANAKASEELARQHMKNAMDTTPEGYNANMELLHAMDIQTSKEMDLYNTKPGGLRLVKMAGGTEQKQLSGKNLFDKSTATDGYAISITGLPYADSSYSCSDYIEVDGGETYTSSKCSWCNYYDESKSHIPDTLVARATATAPSNAKYVRLSFGATKKDSVQFELGEVATDYEEYCGAQPSPSPEYKQSINNTGDCVEMISGYYANGILTSPSTTAVCSKYKIPCKSGDKIELATEIALNHDVHFYSDNGYLSRNGKESILESEFIVPDGATYFTFHVGKTNGLSPSTAGKIQLTVNGKYVTQIVELGEDEMLNATKTNGYLNSNGVATAANSWYHKIFEVDSGYEYVLVNGVHKVDAPKHCWFDCNMNFISARTPQNTMTLIPPSNAKYLGISYTSEYPACVQKRKIHTIYTAEPIRAGDVIEKAGGLWTVERNRYRRVFNGTEGAWDYQYSSSLLKNAYCYKGISTYLPDKTINTGNALCSHFTKIDAAKDIFNGFRFGDGSTNYMIWFYPSNFTTLDEWKAWLAEKYASGNPVVVEYELATPTYEILDTASQLALNALETFNDVTYIEIDSRVQPEGCDWEYGTSQVSARCIKNELHNDSMEIKYNELATALVAIGSEV